MVRVVIIGAGITVGIREIVVTQSSSAAASAPGALIKLVISSTASRPPPRRRAPRSALGSRRSCLRLPGAPQHVLSWGCDPSSCAPWGGASRCAALLEVGQLQAAESNSRCFFSKKTIEVQRRRRPSPRGTMALHAGTRPTSPSTATARGRGLDMIPSILDKAPTIPGKKSRTRQGP